MRIRPATDDDSEGLIRLIGAIFAEYPGCVLDVDLEEPELRAPAGSFDAFWVLEDGAGEVAGCIGLVHRGETVELKKLYMDRALRRRGWGRRLAALVVEEARRRGAGRIELWSDTRFVEAHALYEALGYEATGRTRDLNDLSNTTEYHYVLDLSGG